MGKCWIETIYGNIIHLPVVGNDINTADGPFVHIPSGIYPDRCMNGTLQIDDDTYGLITLDFNAPGRTGSCNQCGMCCGHPVADCPGGPYSPIACGYILNTDINWHVCQYLTITNWHKWGQKNNSECSIWSELIDRYKGCVLAPISADKIHSWWTACEYEFV